MNNSAMATQSQLKISKVWEHFTLSSAKKVVDCNICKADFAWHGNTSVASEEEARWLWMMKTHLGKLVSYLANVKVESHVASLYEL